MVCIYCGSKTSVTNSRSQKRSRSTWRRRHCSSCQATFTTQETVDLGSSVGFLDARGVLHPFNRQRLFLSLYDSLRHRSRPDEDAVALTDTVIHQLLPKVQSARLDRKVVITAVHATLKRFDKAAAVQYAAFHPL